MSTKPPTDQPLERAVNPVRPATATPPRKPAAPPQKSGFQRFMLQFLLLVIAIGGAFGTGYLVNANEMQTDRNDLLQQQLDAQQRILALEQQIAELRDTRESGNRVELDLTEVFEPIREAVGRIALVRMGEISREITTELTRLVQDDIPNLDDPANAAGMPSPPPAAPGGIRGDDGGGTPEPEAASSAGDTAEPQSGGGPDSLQPDSAAFDAAGPPDQPEAVEFAGNEPAATGPPASSIPPPVTESLAADVLGLPAASEETSRSEAADPPAGGPGTASAEGVAQPEPGPSTDVAELVGTLRPPGPGDGVPINEP